MREIKFRAWDNREKRDFNIGQKMIYDIERTWSPYGDSFSHYMSKEHMIIMQYTGRKDRNGKDIYDGDIDIDGDVVEFDKHACIFKIGRNWLHSASSTLIQIVGNKYENPELWHGSK